MQVGMYSVFYFHDVSTGWKVVYEFFPYGLCLARNGYTKNRRCAVAASA